MLLSTSSTTKNRNTTRKTRSYQNSTTCFPRRQTNCNVRTTNGESRKTSTTGDPIQQEGSSPIGAFRRDNRIEIMISPLRCSHILINVVSGRQLGPFHETRHDGQRTLKWYCLWDWICCKLDTVELDTHLDKYKTDGTSFGHCYQLISSSRHTVARNGLAAKLTMHFRPGAFAYGFLGLYQMRNITVLSGFHFASGIRHE